MSEIKMSFDEPVTMYEMLFMGMFPMGVTLHACEEGSGLITTVPMPEYGVVWATGSLLVDEANTPIEEGTLGGVAVLLNRYEGTYTVLANDYDGEERYGTFTREQAEDLISSGVLG